MARRRLECRHCRHIHFFKGLLPCICERCGREYLPQATTCIKEATMPKKQPSNSMFSFKGMRAIVAALMESVLYFTLPLKDRKELAIRTFMIAFNVDTK